MRLGIIHFNFIIQMLDTLNSRQSIWISYCIFLSPFLKNMYSCLMYTAHRMQFDWKNWLGSWEVKKIDFWCTVSSLYANFVWKCQCSARRKHLNYVEVGVSYILWKVWTQNLSCTQNMLPWDFRQQDSEQNYNFCCFYDMRLSEDKLIINRNGKAKLNLFFLLLFLIWFCTWAYAHLYM